MFFKHLIIFLIFLCSFFIEQLQSQCNAKFKPTANVNNLSCVFQNQSSGGMLWYFWDFGDGTFITDTIKQNQTHFYSQPGIYKVTLTVQDTAPIACIGSYSEYVVLANNTMPGCFAHFTYVVNNNTVTFTNQSIGLYHVISWNFGDGSFGSNIDSFSHVYSGSGYFPVTLSIIDTVNHFSSVEVQNIYIPVANGCAAAFTILNIDSVTHTVAFNSSIFGNYTDLLWDFGDGTVAGNAMPIHKYGKPGLYKVSLTIFNSNNNSYGIYEEIIAVNKKQLVNKADFNYIADVNLPGKVYFTNNSINADNIQCLWNFGDGNFSTEWNPLHYYSQPGIYNVAFTIYNNDLKLRNTINKKISTAHNNLCNSDFAYVIPQNLPINTVQFFENSPSLISQQIWNFGDNSGFFSHSRPQHTYAASGFYPVLHKVSNNNNHHQQLEWVNVNSNDSALHVYFEYYLDSINTKATATTGYKSAVSREVSRVHWNFGNGVVDTTTLEPIYQYPDTGSYQVCLTVWEYNRPDSVVFCRTVNVTSIGIPEKDEKTFTTFIYPNPLFDNSFSVYENFNHANIQFGLIDALGRTIPIDIVQKSEYLYTVSIKNKVAEGIYSLIIQHNNFIFKNKIVILY